MPSWVSDWNELPTSTSLAESFSSSTGRCFTAGGLPALNDVDQRFSVDAMTLTAQGAISHEVNLINEIDSDRVPDVKNLSRMLTIWHDLETVTERWPYLQYIAGETLGTIRTSLLYGGQTLEPHDAGILSGAHRWDPLSDLGTDIPTDPDHPDAEIISSIVQAAQDDPLEAKAIARTVAGRKLAVLNDSTKGYRHVGLVPMAARDGDKICILKTCSVPLVLRPTTYQRYRLIGDSYVHGVMHGELAGSLKWKDIDIE